MATPKEMRKIIGKTIKFKSSITNVFMCSVWSGIVGEQVRSETCIDGRWHDTKSIEIIEILKDEE